MSEPRRHAPILTVAIPFYEGVDYLREAIESVRAQDDPRWCLRVHDDAPRDLGAEAVLREFEDARITYQRNEHNLGMVPNWNACLDAADSELVCLLHGDDRLERGYLRTMAELMGRHPEAVAGFCEARIVDERGRARFSLADAVKPWFQPRTGPDGALVLEGEDALRRLMAGNFIMCPTLCFRRARLAGRRFAPEWQQAQDLELTSRLLLEGETLVGSRARVYTYRRHAESATERQSESLLRFDEEFRLFGRVAEACRDRGWNRAARTSRHAAIVHLHLLYRALRDLAGLRARAAWRKLRFLAARPI